VLGGCQRPLQSADESAFGFDVGRERWHRGVPPGADSCDADRT